MTIKIPQNAQTLTAALLKERPDATVDELFECLDDLVGLNTCSEHAALIRGLIRLGLEATVAKLRPSLTA